MECLFTWVIVSYYDVSIDACPDNSHTTTVIPLSISIDNLPWGDAAFTWQRWVHSPRRWMLLGPLKLLRLPPLGTEIVLYVDDLEARRERLMRAGYRPGKIRVQPWGNRDFRVRDADGYHVRVSDGTWAGREAPG